MSENKTYGVILLAKPESGRRLAERLLADGLDAISVASSSELHGAIKLRPIDFLVIEQALDEFLTGLEIIERLQSNLLHPATVLIGELRAEENDKLARLGIHSVFDSDGLLEEIAGAVASQVSSSVHRATPIPFQARKLAKEAAVIRPLPQLLTKLCNCLGDDQIALPELAKDISVDPRMCAELLRVTNSTAAGLSRKVSGVREAVLLLGLKRTISVVLSTGLLSVQSTLLKSLPQPLQKWYQIRSVLTASAAAAFADRMERISPDTAHVLGLFQDLGMLVLANAQPKYYEQILQRTRTVGQVKLEQLEREEFGVTHADVSAALLEHWEVPARIVDLVFDHHLPERRGPHTDAEGRFLQVMRVAEAYANIADAPSPHRHRALAALLDCYGSNRAGDCRATIALGISQAADLSRIYALPSPDEATIRSLFPQPSETPEELTIAPALEASSPAAEPETVDRPAQAAKSRPVGSKHRHRVLVIDDEVAIIKLITRQLETTPFEVVPCNRAEDATTLIDDVEAIVCDVHLGCTSGIDVVLKLRELGTKAPVIMISGDRSRETVVGCIDAGTVDYLIKPFSRESLVRKLTKNIERCAEPAFRPAEL